jgi:transcriptional regulator with XRE-family HTH domain
MVVGNKPRGYADCRRDPGKVRMTSQFAAWRIKAGFKTYLPAAEVLGISRVHLIQIEKGKSGAGPEVLAGMSRLYGVSLERIRAASYAAQKAWLRQRSRELIP